MGPKVSYVGQRRVCTMGGRGIVGAGEDHISGSRDGSSCKIPLRSVGAEGSCARKIPLRECASGSIAYQKRLTEVFGCWVRAENIV